MYAHVYNHINNVTETQDALEDVLVVCSSTAGTD